MNMRGDWRYEAEQYHEIDQDVMARIEGDQAFEYFKTRNRWPEGMSVRAWDYLKAKESEFSRHLPARNESERESGRRTY